MARQDKSESNFRRIGNTDKEEFESEIASLTAQGWVVEKRWEEYNCHFAELTKQKG